MYWISDPGHAWLRVSLKKVFELGIQKKISKFSYLKNGYAYLEEDQDAWIFLEASGKMPRDFKDNLSNKYSCVRNYYNYSVENAIKLYNFYN